MRELWKEHKALRPLRFSFAAFAVIEELFSELLLKPNWF
jgi:hypothetical protein